MPANSKSLKLGLLSAVAAHVLWGVFPLFWRLTNNFDALQVVGHRVVWSFVTLAALMPLLWIRATSEDRQELRVNVKSGRVWGMYALAGGLVAINWLTFIWAVNNGRVLEASLGYYINPLLNVLLGVWILSERLSRLQWAAIAVATLGVAVMTYSGGGLPWISLILASSFALYGLVKKRAPLPTLVGLLLETTTLLIPALILLGGVELGAFGDARLGAYSTGGLRLLVILFLGGTVTILPLAFFAYAAKRVPLSTLGIMQYIGPTLQFLIGIWVLNEDFDSSRFVGFAFVWVALAIYMFSLRAKLSN